MNTAEIILGICKYLLVMYFTFVYVLINLISNNLIKYRES